MTGSPDVLSPSTYEELADLIRGAEAGGGRLVPSGLGNHLGLPGAFPEGAPILSLAKFNRVLRYEPGDFTVGVQAGISVGELRAVLAGNGQELPVDLSPSGTIGGALAQNRSGPRRGRWGTLRNYLIGISGIRGGGRLWKSGGMVVKNAAGFDVGKLLIGSRGTLGPVLEANFKLRAIPSRRSMGIARFDLGADAWGLARSFRERALEPSAILVLSPGGAHRLGGALGGPPVSAWTALWIFEGNAGAIAWLEGQAERLLSASRTGSTAALGDGLCPKVLDLLSELGDGGPSRENGAGSGEIALRLLTLPSAGPAAAEALDGAVRSADPSGGWVISDAAAGVHLAGAGGAGEKALAAAEEIARSCHGAIQVLRAPQALRERSSLLFREENPEISERIRRVFDPRGVFSIRCGEGRPA